MKHTTLLGLFVSLLLTKCAGTNVPRISPDHPASPSAQEAPLPPKSLTLGGEPVHTDKEGEKGQTEEPAEQSEDVVYVCPMDPDVMQGAPGECPNCGMDLIPEPREREREGGGSDGHSHEQ